MTDSKEWCDGDWRWRSSSRPFAGAESGSPGRALEAGKRRSPGRAVQAGIRGKRLTIHCDTHSGYFTDGKVTNWATVPPNPRYSAVYTCPLWIVLQLFSKGGFFIGYRQLP